jgi:hypothetical protein
MLSKPRQTDTRTAAYVIGRQAKEPASVDKVQIAHAALSGAISDADLEAMDFEAAPKDVSEVFPIEDFIDRIMMRPHRSTGIPEPCKPLFSRCVIQVLDLIVGYPQSMRSWCMLLAMEFLLLQRPGKVRSPGSLKRIVQQRLLRFLDWDIEELLEDAERQWLVNESLRSDRVASTDARGSTARSERLIMAGRNAEALKEVLLNGGGLRLTRSAQTDAVIAKKMRSGVMPTHIDTLKEWEHIQSLAGFVAPLVTAKTFLREFGAIDKSRGPGASGFSYGHMADALRSPDTKARVAKGFAAVMTLIANGRVPKLLWPYWHGGRGGLSGADGARLFIAGETLQKFTERVLVRTFLSTPEGKKALKYNVGVGFRGSADWLAAWAERIRRENKNNADLVFIEVDARNMFLELVRTEVLKMVRTKYPQLYPLVMHLSGPMFVGFFRGEQLGELQGGISIGAAASSLIASCMEELVLEKLYAHCVEKALWMEQSGFIDNVFFGTTLNAGAGIVAKLNDLGKPFGLLYDLREDHPHKLCLANPGLGDASRMQRLVLKSYQGYEVTAMWEEKDIANQTEDVQRRFPPKARGLKLAGVPVGTPLYHTAGWSSRLSKVETICTVLQAGGVHPKSATIMLRKCVLLKLAFLARVTPVSVALVGAKAFDTLMLDTLNALCEGSGSWSTGKNKKWLQVTWGLGMLEESIYPAMLASMASVWKNGLRPVPPTIMHLKESYNSRVFVEDQLQGVTPEEVMKSLVALTKPQKTLCSKVQRMIKHKLVATITERESKLLGEMSRKDANLWRDCPSYDGVRDPQPGEEQSLRPEAFRAAVRQRMPGLNVHGLPEQLVKTGLVCGAVSKAGKKCSQVCQGETMEHPLWHCPMCFGPSHSKLQSTTCDIARDAGCSVSVVKVEPIGPLEPGAKMHADIKMYGLVRNKAVVVDVSCNSRFAVGVGCDFAEKTENTKVRDYSERYKAGGEVFLPFVISTLGGFGSQCWKLIRLMAVKLQSTQGTAIKVGEKRIKAVVQCAMVNHFGFGHERFMARHQSAINAEHDKADKAEVAAQVAKAQRARAEQERAFKENAARVLQEERIRVNASLPPQFPPSAGARAAANMATLAAAKANIASTEANKGAVQSLGLGMGAASHQP